MLKAKPLSDLFSSSFWRFLSRCKLAKIVWLNLNMWQFHRFQLHPKYFYLFIFGFTYFFKFKWPITPLFLCLLTPLVHTFHPLSIHLSYWGITRNALKVLIFFKITLKQLQHNFNRRLLTLLLMLLLLL